MQKFILSALAAFAAVSAFPQAQQQPEHAPVYILRHEADVNQDGYHFAFETSDGTSRQEQGTLKQISDELRAIAVSGSYQFTDPEGVVHSVTYTADDNGFKPIEHAGHAGDSAPQQSGQEQQIGQAQQYQQYPEQPQQ